MTSLLGENWAELLACLLSSSTGFSSRETGVFLRACDAESKDSGLNGLTQPMWRFRCNSLEIQGCGGRLSRQIPCNLFLISTTQVLHATGFRGRKDTVLSWELFTEPVRFPLIFFWHQQLALPSFRGHWLHLSQLYNIPLPIFTQAQCCVSQRSVIRQGGVCSDVHNSGHILLGILYPSSAVPDLLHVCVLVELAAAFLKAFTQCTNLYSSQMQHTS